MYGVDYPHPEGSWLRTNEWLQQVFGGTEISEADMRSILGENAIDLYDLDRPQLRSIAERVGPTYQHFAQATPRALDDWGDTFAYMASPYRRAGLTPGSKVGDSPLRDTGPHPDVALTG
jgi:hypothetical protein